MSGVKGGLKVEICQDPCVPVAPCQNVTPAPVQCVGTVDPCQANQSGVIGGGNVVIGGYGGQVPQGGQVTQGFGGVKK